MNIDRLEALLWARIDGTIEPEELAELEAHLAEQVEPVDIERQIAGIAKDLDTMDRVPPPEELRGRIDAALAGAVSPAITAPRVETVSTWKSRWLPMAATLLIGVAVGYLLHPGAGGSIDQAEIAGSMLTPGQELESAPVEILFDGASVVARRVGTDVVADLTLTTDLELGVTLAGAEGPVRLASLNSTTSSTNELRTEHGWIVLRTRGPGTVVLAIATTTPDDPLRIQVTLDGVPTEERWIGPSGTEVER